MKNSANNYSIPPVQIYVVKTNLDAGTTGHYEATQYANSALYTGFTPNYQVEIISREIKKRVEIGQFQQK